MSGELRGWKEISAFLGVTERTAQRWESELNLPIHRFRQRGASPVFSLSDELDTWRRSAEGVRAAAEQTAAPSDSTDGETSDPQASLEPTAGGIATRATRKRLPVQLGALAVVMSVAVVVFLLGRPGSGSPPKTPAASNESYAYSSADSPFVITLEIVGSDDVKFRARSHGGQMIQITLVSGAKYALVAVQEGAAVSAFVAEPLHGGRGVKVLQRFRLARGVPQTFSRGSDSFRFEWLSSEPVPEGATWASRQLQGCGMDCAASRPASGRSPATFVAAAEVVSPCGTCCDPDFGACSVRRRQRP